MALFSLRTLPERLRGEAQAPPRLRLDEMGGDGPGFQVLADVPGEGFVVGAVGRFWEPHIPYASVTPQSFAAFEEPGFGKVAWELRFEPRGEHATRITLELRVGTTDAEAWQHFRRYFRLVGPFSRFIRHHLLSLMARELGSPESRENERPLPGDERVQEAKAQLTHGITIEAPPEDIWPWLVRMGGRRAGWYSHDVLDNAGRPSARELVPELQHLQVGELLPGTPRMEEGFFVQRLEPPRVLVLCGLYDLEQQRQVRPGEPRPEHFWETSWAFVLEAPSLAARGNTGQAGGRATLRGPTREPP